MAATCTMRTKWVSTLAVAAVAFSLAASAWAKDDPMRDERERIDAQKTLDDFKRADPSLADKLMTSAGYAVFASVGKGGLVLGGADGIGVLYEKGQAVGRLTISQLTVGAQAGAQAYSELILLENEKTLADIKRGALETSNQGSLVIATAGASDSAKFERGVQVYALPRKGLMVEATVGLQHFNYAPYPAAPPPAVAVVEPTPTPAPAPEPAPGPEVAEAPPAPAAATCATDPKDVLAKSSLHFAFDKSDLNDKSQKLLRDVADAMKDCATANILIAGNADERGTNAYNMALGQRRADAARDFLIKAGIDASRIDTVSYGEERPADPRHNEAGWALNRRADFSMKSAAVSLR